MKPELLAPAGNPEKLKTALYYGADAVYCGGKDFSLRALSDNFSEDELKAAVDYTHILGKKFILQPIYSRLTATFQNSQIILNFWKV